MSLLSSRADRKFLYLIDIQTTLAVAIAYHLQKAPYVFPIIGGRKVEQLEGNITALDIPLTPEQVKRIESAVPFDPGFPNKMIVSVVT